MKIGVVLLAAALLAGCKLLDQTTFAPSPEPEVPVAPVIPQADPRTPLVSIGYDTPNPNYQELLRYAVRAAETRAPGLQYDVVAVMPSNGDVARNQGRTADVMRTIQAAGVAANRIHLGLRMAAANTPPMVRVYVR